MQIKITSLNRTSFSNYQRIKFFIAFLFLLLSINSYGQNAATDTVKSSKEKVAIETESGKSPQKKWFEKISMRGYTQVRYNRFLETNKDLKCEQCDRSWGENGGLFIRRIRLIFFGQVEERLYIYIQPDFASSASNTSLHFGQVRDAYFDLALDKKQEFRLRFGQSKIPYGFENMQSSQNRLTLDRNDALNSALSNERDIAALFYWAPAKIRERFSHLVSSGLKGSGDYGVVGIGVFNGQTANRPEANNSVHAVARVSYPFQIKGQIIEAGVQAYTGNVVVTSVSSGIKAPKGGFEYQDQRVAGSFTLYPQPFGIQAEYTYGTGPEYNPVTNTIDQQKLQGGYVLTNYMLKFSNQTIFPFVKYQYYDGGKKHEQDARSYEVRELEIGAEWQPLKYFELVAQYTMSNRKFEDAALRNNRQEGNLLRLQVQFNY